ncbi:DUF1189 family protein [Acholeplasma granularum]|uniref:DUF1189 family protein n=1 Tax=Acholeplasma granularum TaxID=264635 RepID=UPI0004712E0A|nr:DUF1189 family protein [Acholeplasma granularum]
MFLVSYFKMGFQFPKLLENSRKVSFIKVFIYFILLTFIANFPLTWLTFEEQGSRINFIEENINSNIPNWTNLPPGMISSGGINESILNGSSYTNGDFIYYFGYNEQINELIDKNIIIFHTDHIEYLHTDGAKLISDGYSGFKDQILLSQLNYSDGLERTEIYNLFARSIEKSFSTQIILYTTLRNQTIQFVAFFIYIVILSIIIQLFRFGFQNFLSFKEGLIFIILSSTLPSVLSLIFGLILPGFAPVVYNLSLGITVMLILLIFSRKNFS